MSVTISLAGKVALITGAATGIGRATAMLFAAAEAKVVLVDVREPELTETVTRLRGAFGQDAAVSVVADLAQPAACADVVAQAIAGVRPARHPVQQRRHRDRSGGRHRRDD